MSPLEVLAAVFVYLCIGVLLWMLFVYIDPNDDHPWLVFLWPVGIVLAVIALMIIIFGWPFARLFNWWRGYVWTKKGK